MRSERSMPKWSRRPSASLSIASSAYASGSCGLPDIPCPRRSNITTLRPVWKAKPFVSVDTEEFYDFTVVRPQAKQVDGRRVTVWPTLDIWSGEIPGTGRDALILTGVEPSIRWRRFRDIVMQVVHEAG